MMNPFWKNDEQLFAVFRQELSTAIVGEVLDQMGLNAQFLPGCIRPLDPRMVVVGRAMPVLFADCFETFSPSGLNPVFAKPFGLMLEALDDLRPMEVFVATGGRSELAMWSELMTVRAVRLGAAGALVDGCVRDTNALSRFSFPIFSRGAFAQDQRTRGKVVDFRVAVQIGNVRVRPGDIIFGDHEGVCILPQGSEGDVVEAALQRLQKRAEARRELESGSTAVEVFAKHNMI
ncbi:MAG: RraA family protein [Thermogutta sp.]|nr:RraA family protein [Thermogutta sp.]HPU06037.1 RraA family protein [Thermogutta sp.]HPZ83712.1 RraA family protein [Thermogutta sp.]HQF12579.1 RraA family protein [Thermogutta sp.]